LASVTAKRCEASRVALIGRGLNSWRRRMCAYVYETLSAKSEGFGKQNLQCFFLGSTPLPKWFKELEYFTQATAFAAPLFERVWKLCCLPCATQPYSVANTRRGRSQHVWNGTPSLCSRVKSIVFSLLLATINEGSQVKYNPKGHG
jgi:hypothetical protein